MLWQIPFCSGCSYGSELVNGEDTTGCIFCRTPDPTSDAERIERCKARMEVNDDGAFYYLGCQYNKGENGLPVDKAKALELWTKAADLGNKFAHCVLGEVYFHQVCGPDYGVQMNWDKAEHHYEAAAIQGEVISRYKLYTLESKRFNLSLCSNNKHLDRMKKHLLIAAASGHEEALKIVGSAYKMGDATKDEYTATLRAYQASHEEMRSVQRDKVAESKKCSTGKVKIEVHEFFVTPVYQPSTWGHLAEPMPTLNEAMKEMSSRGLNAEEMLSQAQQNNTQRDGFSFGSYELNSTEPTAKWRPQNGEPSFMGSVQNPLKGTKKLDNPVDFLQDADAGNFDDVCPGHYMSKLEGM